MRPMAASFAAAFFAAAFPAVLAAQVSFDRIAGAARGPHDWLTYSGPSDPHYFAYDPVWGGLVGVPPEFGNQDYNDHHLQYGYLVRAAATMAAADPAFARAST